MKQFPPYQHVIKDITGGQNYDYPLNTVAVAKDLGVVSYVAPMKSYENGMVAMITENDGISIIVNDNKNGSVERVIHAHLLAHYLLIGYVSDFNLEPFIYKKVDGENCSSSWVEEVWVNRFVEELLMPKQEFPKQMETLNKYELMNYFGVPFHMLMKRLERFKDYNPKHKKDTLFLVE